ncbi:PDR/VanB family oxidoreductase [Actinocorallia aurantiaca]|uniref:PDR/VanB family oxidoreductase n=1 Tax=Actinocorallia aurantiaca TaxID=46204 RepID=A0ABP6H460_9ACTN
MTLRASQAGPSFDAVIERKETVADGVVELVMRTHDGADLPVWEPGSHIDLVFGDGLVRQYSLCGEPGDRRSIRVAVLRAPDGRGGSAFVHDRLAVGDAITLRGPRNNFRLVDADRYLFVAGGIGITPLLPMLRSVNARSVPWRLAYGGRTRASMAYADDLMKDHPGSVEILPEDETGLLPLDRILRDADDRTAVYCCGPEPLLSAVEQMCARFSIGNLNVERFAPRADAEAAPTTSFEIELFSSGRTLQVGPDESILDVLERAGVPVDSSCREGTCATCETGVVAGVPDHRDAVLNESERSENKTMMICVSRCQGLRLVLDV